MKLPTYYIRRLFAYISNPLKAKYLLFLMNNGYLYEKGWLNSLLHSQAIDKNNNPIPWLSYPAIDFLKHTLTVDADIFEYGAGNSTIYYSKHFKSVTAVENNPEWYNKLKVSLENKKNCKLILATETENYIRSIQKENKMFDLIIVDGRWRNECLKEAINYIKDDGLLILDDAERERYQPSIEFVKDLGYYPILFKGMSALSFEEHTTLIFKKQN